MGLSAESCLLVECCKRRLDAGRISASIASVDWEAFIDLCIQNGVGPLSYLALKQHSEKMPPFALKRLETMLYETTARNMMLVDGAVRVLSTLSAAGIDVILLKGLHLQLEYYAPDYMRPTNDVDILVRSRDVEAAERALVGLGYAYIDEWDRSRGYWARFGHHYTYLNRACNTVVDLHWHVVRDFSQVGIPEECIWGGARQVEYHGVRAFLMPPNMLLIHLCLHFAMSGFFHVTPLRCLCDIDRIVSKGREGVDWPSFAKECERYGCQAFAYKSLELCSQILRTEVPAGVIEALRESSPRRHLYFVDRRGVAGIIQRPRARYSASDFIWEIYLSTGMRRLNLLQRPLYVIFDRIKNSVLSGRP